MQEKIIDIYEEINSDAINIAINLCRQRNLCYLSEIIRASEYPKDEDKYYIMTQDPKTKYYSSWFLVAEEGNEQLLCKSIDYEKRLDCHMAMLKRVCVVINSKENNLELQEKYHNLCISQAQAKTLNFFLWLARKRSDRELSACENLIDMFAEENPKLSSKLTNDKQFIEEMNATIDEIIPKIAEIAYKKQEDKE